MKKQFFIFIWNFKLGGIQKHCVLLSNNLVNRGWQVTILVQDKSGELLSKLDKRVSVTTFKISKTNNPFHLYRTYIVLKKLIPAHALVLANGPNNFHQISRINYLFKRWRILYILQNDLELRKKRLV